MDKVEIIELPDFEYTTKGFGELKTALIAGKIIRNPFAKLYCEEVTITVVQDADVETADE